MQIHGVDVPDYLRLVRSDYFDDNLISCDIIGCFACETDWIVHGVRSELIPIFRDTRPEFLSYNICLDCVRAGRHLEEAS